ncbi:MAG: transposase [Thermoflexales bacterium]|nr:transposase [Thermoflexales bacterium]
MPQRDVQFAQGQYYHIYNRGIGRQPIFRESDNYLYVLRLMKKYAVEFQVTVIAYCLMPNHYHFLLRQDGEYSVGLFPQRIFNSYTKAFNKRYSETGTLFAGRYKAVHIGKDEYLLHLCRYIHANPVKAGLVTYLEDWPYSNYHEWIGTRQGTLIDHDWARGHFPTAYAYRQFVLDYVTGLDKLPEGVKKVLVTFERKCPSPSR